MGAVKANINWFIVKGFCLKGHFRQSSLIFYGVGIKACLGVISIRWSSWLGLHKENSQWGQGVWHFSWHNQIYSHCRSGWFWPILTTTAFRRKVNESNSTASEETELSTVVSLHQTPECPIPWCRETQEDQWSARKDASLLLWRTISSKNFCWDKTTPENSIKPVWFYLQFLKRPKNKLPLEIATCRQNLFFSGQKGFAISG